MIRVRLQRIRSAALLLLTAHLDFLASQMGGTKVQNSFTVCLFAFLNSVSTGACFLPQEVQPV